MPTQEQVTEALKKVKFPGLSRDIVSFGFIRDLQVDGANVSFTIHFQTENPSIGEQIARDSYAAVKALEGVGDLRGGHRLGVVAAHGQVAGGGHLAGDGPQAARRLALLLGQAQVDGVLLAGRLVVQLQGLHVGHEGVGHGLGDLGELRGQHRVLGQALATGLLVHQRSSSSAACRCGAR